MSEALAQLMASKQWPFIWPCYALAVATFAGLALRAVAQLRHWEKAARDSAALTDAER
jgi:TRAP-type C4-dicarboxylate transport system permease small subunit